MSTAILKKTNSTRQPSRQSNEAGEFSIPADARTLAGFRKWILNASLPPGWQLSYVSGEIFIHMSPERIGTHNAVKSELNYVLVHLTRDTQLGHFFPDGVLVSNESADVSSEPDAIFVLNSSLKSGKVRLVPSADGKDFVEIEGSPDMVCEILSPSSVRKDKIRLIDNYYRAGISEYWLIDAIGDSIQFTVFRRAPTAFEPTPAQDGWVESTVFGRRFRLERHRDEFDTWAYRLHAEPLHAATP